MGADGDIVFESEKTGFSVRRQPDSSNLAFASTPYMLMASYGNKSSDICRIVCLLLDDEHTLRGGIFEHFQEEMLMAEFTKEADDLKTARMLIEQAHEMGRPWSMRSFKNHEKIYLTFSFQDMPRVIEFKLRT